MRVLLLVLFLQAAHSAPQAYNYQVQIGSGNANDITQEQYQLLQEYVQQQEQQSHQQQPQQLEQQQLQQQQQSLESVVENKNTGANLATLSQSLTETAKSGGYQFANELVQQVPQEVDYQQQHQLQQITQFSNTFTQGSSNVPATSEHTAGEPQVAHLEEAAQRQQTHELEHQQHHHEEQLQHVHKHLLGAQLPQVEARQQPHAQVQYSHQLPAPQLQPQQYQPTRTAYQQPQPTTRYNKEFYYLSAPEEEFEDTHEVQQQLSQLKKNIRVVFIKAPEQNSLSNVALELAKQTAESKTAIYVLTKQHDSSELAQQLHKIRSGSQAKPEVVFVKYRTPEEADKAQRTIQAQYESLDGPNHFNHEGAVSPTHSFLNTAGVDPRQSTALTTSTAEDTVAPGANYLPTPAKH